MIDLKLAISTDEGRPAGLLLLPSGPPRRLLICVHGFTRQPLEQAEAFAPLAQAQGWALLLPLFDESRHRRYARLRPPGANPRRMRADLALIALVDDLADRYALPRNGWGLFGYSAGAQFAHRFALLHPDRLSALALGAAGWYTWPERTRRWPHGLTDAPGEVDLMAFLRLPIRLWVGERDSEPDRYLREDGELNDWQGPGRLQRAQRWAASIARAREPLGLPAPAVLEIPGAGHSFVACQRRGRLAQAVVGFIARAASLSEPCVEALVGSDRVGSDRRPNLL